MKPSCIQTIVVKQVCEYFRYGVSRWTNELKDVNSKELLSLFRIFRLEIFVQLVFCGDDHFDKLLLDNHSFFLWFVNELYFRRCFAHNVRFLLWCYLLIQLLKSITHLNVVRSGKYG